MKTWADKEAEILAALVCSDPPMTKEAAIGLIAAALHVAETRGEISGMRHVNDRLDAALHPARELRVA